MMAGLAAIIMFNVVDTFFIGQLGADQLAAMSFTFPAVFVFTSLAIGLGIGATATIARAIGQGDTARVRRLTTDALLLALIVVVVIAVAGLLTIRPVFRSIGAPERLLPLIESYMEVWYWGIGLLVIPIVGNAAIRATGDTKTPSIIMAMAGLLNVALDPLLIFGIGPFPRLELQGAAIATVVSWSITFIAALWVLIRREKMLVVRVPAVRQVIESWRALLYVGLPSAGTNVLVPLASGVLTRLVADYGPNAVAAYGVATRIESVAMIGVFGLSMAATPFVGQNYGAGNCARLRAALRFGLRANLVLAVVVAAFLALSGRALAGVFSDDPAVVSLIARYLLLVPISYGLIGTSMFVNSMYNGSNKPMSSAVIIVLRLAAFTIPFAYLGAQRWGLDGVFLGIAMANVATGLTAIAMVRRFLVATETRLRASEPQPSTA